MNKPNIAFFTESYTDIEQTYVRQFMHKFNIIICSREEFGKFSLNQYYNDIKTSDMIAFYFQRGISQWLSYYIGIANAFNKPIFMIGSPTLPEYAFHGTTVSSLTENEHKFLVSQENFFHIRDAFEIREELINENIKIEQFFDKSNIRYRKTYGQDRYKSGYECTIKSDLPATSIRYEYTWRITDDIYKAKYNEFKENAANGSDGRYRNILKKSRRSYKVDDYIISFDEISIASYIIYVIEVETSHTRAFPDIRQVMTIAGIDTSLYNLNHYKDISNWSIVSNKNLSKINLRSSVEVNTLKTALNEIVPNSMIKK